MFAERLLSWWIIVEHANSPGTFGSHSERPFEMWFCSLSLAHRLACLGPDGSKSFAWMWFAISFHNWQSKKSEQTNHYLSLSLAKCECLLGKWRPHTKKASADRALESRSGAFRENLKFRSRRPLLSSIVLSIQRNTTYCSLLAALNSRERPLSGLFRFSYVYQKNPL